MIGRPSPRRRRRRTPGAPAAREEGGQRTSSGLLCVPADSSTDAIEWLFVGRPHPNWLRLASSVTPHGFPQRSRTRLWVLRRRGTMPTRAGSRVFHIGWNRLRGAGAGLPYASIQQNNPISKAPGCPRTRRRVWWRRGSPARRISSQLCKANPHLQPPHARWKAAINHQANPLSGRINQAPCSAHHYRWDARARGTSASATPGTHGASAS